MFFFTCILKFCFSFKNELHLHVLTILFFQLVVLYVDFKLDESYTPSKISIRAGDGFHNLKVRVCVCVCLGID